MDIVCAQIFEEMEKRNWSVPGIFCKKDGMEVVKMSGKDFSLKFYRGVQNSRQGAVMTLLIPKKELTVFSDYSGPVMYVYVGLNWEVEKEWFKSAIKTNSKLNNNPRRYLYYSRSGGVLKHDTDLGREYGLEAGDPAQYSIQEVYKEFCNWLTTNVLEYIRKQK